MRQETMARSEPGGEQSAGERWCGGYWLLDPLGQRLGRVDRVFCNPGGDPQYVRVRTGLFGRRPALIPVVDVAVNHEQGSLTLG